MTPMETLKLLPRVIECDYPTDSPLKDAFEGSEEVKYFFKNVYKLNGIIR